MVREYFINQRHTSIDWVFMIYLEHWCTIVSEGYLALLLAIIGMLTQGCSLFFFFLMLFNSGSFYSVCVLLTKMHLNGLLCISLLKGLWSKFVCACVCVCIRSTTCDPFNLLQLLSIMWPSRDTHWFYCPLCPLLPPTLSFVRLTFYRSSSSCSSLLHLSFTQTLHRIQTAGFSQGRKYNKAGILRGNKAAFISLCDGLDKKKPSDLSMSPFFFCSWRIWLGLMKIKSGWDILRAQELHSHLDQKRV